MRTIVLASGSPYRKLLLGRLRLSFESMSPEVDETAHAGERGTDLVKRLALLKARAGAMEYPEALIIGCDQCARHRDSTLGKPGNFAAAFQQLREVAGHSVDFHTGLCVLNAATGEAQIDDIEISVTFRPLSDQQIVAYLHAEAPYDCAGSIKSEALGIALVERIHGDDPTALIGLPLIRLTSMLARAGVNVI